MSLSNYPPGVSGNEPQITGEWPCSSCGARLPEEVDCPTCEGSRMIGSGVKVECPVCQGSGSVSFDGDECPDGCDEPPEPEYPLDVQATGFGDEADRYR